MFLVVRACYWLLSVSDSFSAMTDCWLWPECYGQKGMCLPVISRVIAIDVENVLVCEECPMPLLSRSDSFRMF